MNHKNVGEGDGQIKSIIICQDRVIRNQIIALQIYMDEAAEYTLYDHLYDNFLTEMFQVDKKLNVFF